MYIYTMYDGDAVIRGVLPYRGTAVNINGSTFWPTIVFLTDKELVNRCIVCHFFNVFFFPF